MDPQRRRRGRAGEQGHAFATALLSAALAISSPALATETHQITATAYYYPRKYYERNGLGKPENIDFTKISKVNYASWQLDSSGNIWGTDSNADAVLLHGPINWNPPSDAKKQCHFATPEINPSCQFHDAEEGLIRRAHMTGTRVYATIGGTDFSEPFSAMAADADARKQFAKRCVAMITNYNFDGIDIDWRFPGSPLDMANYSLLLSEVRDELDQLGVSKGGLYGLTATLPCGFDYIANFDIFYLDLILEEFNLLTVNFHGPWESTVGASAPLYEQTGEKGKGLSVDSCVSAYLDAGASKEKVNVALPFYAASFVGASALGDECTRNWAGDCSDTVTWQGSSGWPPYFQLYEKLPDMNRTFDIETSSSFAYNDLGIVSFDDERSICLKTEYVIENELGGFIVFGLGDDMLDTLSTPLLDAMNLKLLNPALNCDSNAFMESLLRQEAIAHKARDEPIEAIEEEISVAEFLQATEIKKEYRYTCGSGEGDAQKRCSTLGWQEGWEEFTCDTGTCPDGMLCFLEICDVLPSAPFVKPVPKGKPKRKPAKLTATHKLVSAEVKVSLSNSTTASLTEDSNMVFSCGVNFHHAETCGQLCPNGLSDCASGEFCFWLECKTDSPELVLTSETAQAPEMEEAPTFPEVMVQQYKCGSTREEALTCNEDCGSSWQCPDGKDCYLIDCPL